MVLRCMWPAAAKPWPNCSPRNRCFPELEPVFEEAAEALLGASPHTPVLPELRRNALGTGQVELKKLLHFISKLRTENDDIHLVVVQETAPVHIGRTHC